MRRGSTRFEGTKCQWIQQILCHHSMRCNERSLTRVTSNTTESAKVTYKLNKFCWVKFQNQKNLTVHFQVASSYRNNFFLFNTITITTTSIIYATYYQCHKCFQCYYSTSATSTIQLLAVLHNYYSMSELSWHDRKRGNWWMHLLLYRNNLFMWIQVN